MKFDFVDIGTSDFDTNLDIKKPNQKILLVEPVKYYLDKLPNGENIFKNNCAVSDKKGKGEIYYVDDEIIKKYNMPEWARGCNSFNKPHETILRFFKELNAPPEFKKDKVAVLTFSDLIELYDITEIGFLKIDTEGHDHVVLKSVSSCIKKGLKIKKIKFEYDPFFGNLNELNAVILTTPGCSEIILQDNNVIMKF